MARVILRDGRVAEVRPAASTGTDRMLLERLFHTVSSESLYYRFFHMVREVSPSDIEGMLQNDGARALSLICVSGGRALGVGTYVRQDETCAEVALLVDDTLHGHGIGTLLLEALAQVAWAYGFRRFEANVLSENQKMLNVFRASGYQSERHWNSDVYILSLTLRETESRMTLQDTREKLATAASLMPFFRPRHVAVIGASRDEQRLGHRLLQNILHGKFQGTVYPVNPSADSVSGVKAYPTVASVPAQVDLAVIAVPSAQILAVVDDCIQSNIRAAIITTSGFREAGSEGAELEQEVSRRLREAGIRLMGPNGLGLVNTDPDVQLNASFAPVMPLRGTMAIASQSGALGIAILDSVSQMDIGVSSFGSTGNKADVSSNDLLMYWEDDAATQMIGLYLESFGNPRKFSRIARRIARKKPILAVKSARTRHGVTASKFPSALMSVEDTTVEALFRQAGIIRVDTLPELFDVAVVLQHVPLPHGKRVAVVTNTAGGAVMAVDAIDNSGLAFVGPTIDLGFEALAEGYRAVLPQVLRDEAVDAVVILFSSVGPSEENAVADAILEAALDVRAHAAQHPEQHVVKPVVGNFLTTGTQGVRTIRRDDVTIPIFPYPEQAVHALARVANYAEYVHEPGGHIPDIEGIDTALARSLVRSWLLNNDTSELPRESVTSLLEAVGIPFHAEGTLGEGRHQPAVTTGISIGVNVALDGLFGPVLRATLPDLTHRTALIPLTDVDAARLTHHPDLHAPLPEAMEQLLLRVSRLVDEVPEIRRLKFTVELDTTPDGSAVVDAPDDRWRIAHPVILAQLPGGSV